jgi:hypothetical protein
MSRWKCIRLALAAALLASGPANVHAAVPCTGSVFAPTANAYQSGSHECSCSARGTFNCLHGNAYTCRFCVSYQLQVRSNGTWEMYTQAVAEPWSQGCESRRTWNWSGGYSGMAVGRYRFLFNPYASDCGGRRVDCNIPEFDITG